MSKSTAAAAPTLKPSDLMAMSPALLEGMKGLYTGPDRQLIELVIGQLTAKPDSQPAAPAMEVVKSLTKTVAKRPAPTAPKVYVQRVEVYRGRARIKGGICKEQIDNVISQLQALKGHPSILTYDECQVQFPWDKEAGRPA